MLPAAHGRLRAQNTHLGIVETGTELTSTARAERLFAFALGSRYVTDEHRSIVGDGVLSGGQWPVVARQSLCQLMPVTGRRPRRTRRRHR